MFPLYLQSLDLWPWKIISTFLNLPIASFIKWKKIAKGLIKIISTGHADLCVYLALIAHNVSSIQVYHRKSVSMHHSYIWCQYNIHLTSFDPSCYITAIYRNFFFSSCNFFNSDSTRSLNLGDIFCRCIKLEILQMTSTKVNGYNISSTLYRVRCYIDSFSHRV